MGKHCRGAELYIAWSDCAVRRTRQIRSIFWHGIAPEPGAPRADSKDPTPALFKQQLQFLSNHYTPISIWEFLRLVEHRDSIDSYRRPPILLGFDDGFRSVLVYALPVLEESRTPAVFFVTAKVIADRSFLPWFVEMKQIIRRARKPIVYRGVSLNLCSEQDRARAKYLIKMAFRASRTETERQAVLGDFASSVGVERPAADDVDDDLRFVTREDLVGLNTSSVLTVASHALTHRHLTDLSHAEQVDEICESDSVLREIGTPYCPVIAYPAGSFDRTTMSVAKDVYRLGFAVLAGSSSRNRYAYPRIGLGRHSVEEVATSVSSFAFR